MFDDPACDDAIIERRASNITQFGPDELSPDVQDEVWRTQGSVTCKLRSTPINPLQPIERIKYEGDQETEFRFGNVMCLVYPDSAASEREQVERVRRAALDLAQRVAADE